MSVQEYTGHISAMRADSDFFGAEDFAGRGDVPVQIVKCNRCVDVVACGKSQKEMFTLTLNIDGQLAAKVLWLKPTNRKQLLKLYGPNVGDWKGKWIWFYVDEVRSPSGGMTLGIRIRDKTDAPNNAKKQTQATSQTVATIVEKYAKRLAELKPEEITPAYHKFDAQAATMRDEDAQAIYQLFAKYAPVPASETVI